MSRTKTKTKTSDTKEKQPAWISEVLQNKPRQHVIPDWVRTMAQEAADARAQGVLLTYKDFMRAVNARGYELSRGQAQRILYAAGGV